jgi:hypothetical protein
LFFLACVWRSVFEMLASAVLLTFRKSWGYLFNNDIGMSTHCRSHPPHMAYIDTDVVTLVASILPILALFQIPDFACAITSGILRARGKQVRALPCTGRHVADRSLSVHWSSTQSQVNCAKPLIWFDVYLCVLQRLLRHWDSFWVVAHVQARHETPRPVVWSYRCSALHVNP